ncbi:ABC transporter ATP-binding protein [bacterium]|nr:ABC transporter ATP-binding protein [bacterium]
MSERKRVIEVRDLTVRFGEKTILENISFDVQEGEIFVVLGPSGCGKTTLLKHMIGLHKPANGSIRINGTDIVQAGDEEGTEEILRSVGVLFQSGALFKSMTLGENVAMPLREKTTLSGDMIEEIVRMKLAMVNLEGRENLMPNEMSGGMQKRGGLARAIALDPAILFFDEPSAGLDPITSVELDELILALNKQLGTTMIVVTHELQSIMKIAQRAIMLDNETHGIVAEGTPDELMASDQPKVRAFFHRERLDGES